MAKNSEARIRANEKYQAANIRRYFIKVNINTQFDIMEYLESVDNIQGTIFQALRDYMKKEEQENKLPEAFRIACERIANTRNRIAETIKSGDVITPEEVMKEILESIES